MFQTTADTSIAVAGEIILDEAKPGDFEICLRNFI